MKEIPINLPDIPVRRFNRTGLIDKEMIERLATIANGGSFANDAAKQYMCRKIVLVLFNLTKDDLNKIAEELKITLD